MFSKILHTYLDVGSVCCAFTLLILHTSGPAELSVMLCSDEHITQLNLEWRGKAEPTDVLSFGMDLDGSEGYPIRVLGDLVISLDTANQQAQERGWVTPFFIVLHLGNHSNMCMESLKCRTTSVRIPASKLYELVQSGDVDCWQVWLVGRMPRATGAWSAAPTGI